MRSRRPIRTTKTQADFDAQSKANVALKSAFKHEVRPADYMFRVWATAIVAGGYFAYMAATKSGQFDISLLLPMGGSWQSHDHTGGLYVETWSTIVVDGLQAGLALWASVLIFLGVYRAVTAHKYVFACFYLGCAFFGFAYVLPNWTQILMNMLIEKCPLLVN